MIESQKRLHKSIWNLSRDELQKENIEDSERLIPIDYIFNFAAYSSPIIHQKRKPFFGSLREKQGLPIDVTSKYHKNFPSFFE